MIQRSRSTLALGLVVAALAPEATLGESPPTPSPTPQSCDVPNRPITAVTRKQPHYPASARPLKLPDVIVLVTVTVSAAGEVKKAVIYKSSGNADIDAAALDSVKGTTYLPQIVDCRAVEADGLFTAEFRPD